MGENQTQAIEGTAESEPIRVLHVDDEVEIASLTAEYLERENDSISIIVETSPKSGLARITEEPIDCVVADYEMPEMNGLAFLTEARAEIPDLPFILFTGKGSEEIASEAITAGVTDYIQKGMGTEQYELLANRIENAVSAQRAGRRLSRQEARFRKLTEGASDLIAVLDEAGRYAYVSPSFDEVLGYEPDDLVGENAFDYLHPGDRKQVETLFEEAVANPDRSPTAEFQFRNATGEWRVLSATGRNMLDDPDVEGFVVNARDVTDRTERERELERYETIIETVSDGVYEVDAEGTYTYVNSYIEKATGYDRDELIGGDPSMILEENAIQQVAERVQGLLAGDCETSTTELEVETKDGTMIPAHAKITPLVEDGGFQGHVGVVRDITEQREQEQELERYRTIVNTVSAGIYALDADGCYTLVNDRMLERTGYDREELLGSHVSTVLPEEAIQTGAELVKVLLTNREKETVMYEAEVESFAGENFPAEVRISLLPMDEGGFQGTVGVVRDITDRKDQQLELRRQNERLQVYETLVETVPAGVIKLDAEGTIEKVNEEGARMVGKTPSELEGLHFTMLVDEGIVDPTVPDQYEALLDELLSHASDREQGTFKTSMVPPDDTTEHTYDVQVALLPYRDEFRGSVIIVRDVTERVEGRNQLRRQNERLEEFASVVSHDLRTPLQVAEGRLELAREEFESNHLEEAGRAIDQMEALIDDLLELAKQGQFVETPQPVELADIAEQSWKAFNGDGELQLTVDDAVVLADPNRLLEVFNNLFQNAVDHNGHYVTVQVGVLANQRGFYIADDGSGIPPDERDAILERGYTTREEGTGFGLAIVRGIVEAHGWEIAVTESDAGGARFEVTGVTFSQNEVTD